MDTTMAAGWVAFWGALGGAVLGAGIAWLGGWLTMRSQWNRERDARGRERLRDAAVVLHREAIELSSRLPSKTKIDQAKTRGLAYERAYEGQQMRSFFAALQIVVALAARDSAHLSAEMGEALKRLIEGRAAQGVPFDLAYVQSMSAELDAIAFMAASWLADPDGFESSRPTIGQMRAK